MHAYNIAACHVPALRQVNAAAVRGRREWLVYRSDPRSNSHSKAYADAELAVGEVNVRFERLNKFSKLHPNWTYYSHDFEHRVLKQLGRHWPIDYSVDDQEP